MTSKNDFSWSFIIYPFLASVVFFLAIWKFESELEPILADERSVDLIDLDKKVADIFSSQVVPGVSVAIFDSSGIIRTAQIGKTKSIMGSPINMQTIFEGASLSKPLTAWAIIKLVSEQKLNLDSLIIDGEYSYTARQLLSHSAGFDNAMGKNIGPKKEAGSFAYSGQGYLKLGDIIASATGVSFEQYMNSTILSELGMNDSYFGKNPDTSRLAYPHISVTLPQAIGALVVCLLSLSLTLLLWIILQLFKKKISFIVQLTIFGIATIGAMALPIVLMGANNGTRFALVNLATLACILLLIYSFMKMQKLVSVHALIGLFCSGLIIWSVMYRPAIPLKERGSFFLPAAGLRTTAADYSKFLIEIMNPTDLHSVLINQMIALQVVVNDHNSWGLGLGIQVGEENAIWHWGVNFPGYQALFVAWPTKNKGAVVLMNGGSFYLTASNPRFKGLELARIFIADIFGHQHFDYWQNVN